MNHLFKIFVSFTIALLIVGCSTKKDAFLNRNFHSINTKYNILYNGHEALRVGLEQLNANYEDNFWERLPVEPLKVDVLAMPGMTGSTDSSPKEFERAEEKAVKAVQKHSMLIARQEHNNQIDDAYLLLGKARYYSKRFVPALEAFNYVISNYPRANLIHETKIWHAKTLVRLRNEEQAIDNLKALLKEENLKDNIIEDANSAMAMAYIGLDNIEKALYHLNKSVLVTNKNKTIAKAMITKKKATVEKLVITTNNVEQTARNLFIIGQLYNEQKNIDSSNIAFSTLTKLKKAPKKYSVRAQLEIAKNASTKQGLQYNLEVLKKMIKNRDNKPFLDEIYYQAGVIENTIDSENAIEYFKNSLRSSSINNVQKELSYEAAGNYYFEKAKFATAGSYYDSILEITTDENSKRIRRLSRKRSNLNDVILYENIAKINDSILTIVAMSEEEQSNYFTSYIEKLKAEDEKSQTLVTSGFGILSNKDKKDDLGKGKWYFYNPQTLGFGEQEFKRVWGNRPLEENWRLSDKTQINFQGNDLNLTENTLKVDDSKKYELAYYLENIPSELSKIDSIMEVRNNAYYKLGVIYKEQFKEPELAIDKLEQLLTYNPNESIKLPAKYHLFKLYSDQNNSKALTVKNEIISNYPTSLYAKIILNPNEVYNEDKTNSPEKEYALVFYEYKENKFDSVIEKANLAISKYEGLPIVPKYELLKAYTIGKKEGLEAFKIALDFVATNYPNTEEGKKALELIASIRIKIEP